jgi:hypothetical protein
MANYKHSELFAKLKSIDESIPDNLTSYQYLSVLDEMVYNGLLPIIEGTQFFEKFLAQILGWQTINSKRKVVGVGRAAFSSYLTLFLLLDDPKQKLKLIKKMKIDRAVLFEAMRRWTSIAQDIERLGTSRTFTVEVLEQLEGLSIKSSLRPDVNLFATFRLVTYWLDQAVAFKSQILEKYTRLVLTTAQRDYVQLNCQGELDDIIQVYFMSAGKAIDKCDTEKGVLTTHIQNWLLSAKNVVISSQLNGTITQAKTKTGKEYTHSLVERVGLETLETMVSDDADEAADTDDLIQEVRRIAKAFDTTGIGRILLNIQEVLTDEDKTVLRAHAL